MSGVKISILILTFVAFASKCCHISLSCILKQINKKQTKLTIPSTHLRRCTSFNKTLGHIKI